ncbi:Enhancer of polycomb-like protein 1 [Quaeritorhiza haematococci]|nr:Enhancer of polycomb-like protein 1 [Quaeritorhiza haematococci]
MPLHSAGAAGLRSRKVDNKRPLPVLRASEVPDLDETASINRTVHAVATGVEKEEEEEHHLQAALHANHAGVTHAQVVIPTPDASGTVDDFDRFYKKGYQQPRSLIRFSAQIEDCFGCGYNLDERDDAWLKDHNANCSNGTLSSKAALNEDQFENLMWGLERLANEKLTNECPPIDEFYNYVDVELPNLSNLKPAIPSLYEWWKSRRFGERNGKSVAPQLRTDELGPKADSDPYSVDKLRRLRDEMRRAREILEAVKQREEYKKQILEVDRQVFEQRIMVRRMKKKLGVVSSEVDATPEKSKKKSKKGHNEELRTGPTKIKIPIQKLKDAAQIFPDTDAKAQADTQLSPLYETLPIEEKIKKRKQLDEKSGWIDLTERPQRPPYAFSPAEPPTPEEDDRVALWATRWRYDNSDDELDDEDVELDDLSGNITFRAFHLCPVSEAECRQLMRKPTFPEQINIQPTSLAQRMQQTPTPPPQVVRAPPPSAIAATSSPQAGPSGQKKRANKTSTDGSTTKQGGSQSSVKKKQNEPLDPRQTMIKQMMQKAQRAAQQQRQAQQIQQLQQGLRQQQQQQQSQQQGNQTNVATSGAAVGVAQNQVGQVGQNGSPTSAPANAASPSNSSPNQNANLGAAAAMSSASPVLPIAASSIPSASTTPALQTDSNGAASSVGNPTPGAPTTQTSPPTPKQPGTFNVASSPGGKVLVGGPPTHPNVLPGPPPGVPMATANLQTLLANNPQAAQQFKQQQLRLQQMQQMQRLQQQQVAQQQQQAAAAAAAAASSMAANPMAMPPNLAGLTPQQLQQLYYSQQQQMMLAASGIQYRRMNLNGFNNAAAALMNGQVPNPHLAQLAQLHQLQLQQQQQVHSLSQQNPQPQPIQMSPPNGTPSSPLTTMQQQLMNKKMVQAAGSAANPNFAAAMAAAAAAAAASTTPTGQASTSGTAVPPILDATGNVIHPGMGMIGNPTAVVGLPNGTASLPVGDGTASDKDNQAGGDEHAEVS